MSPIVLTADEQKLSIRLREIIERIYILQGNIPTGALEALDEETLVTQGAEVAIKLHGLLEQRGIRPRLGTGLFRASFGFYSSVQALNALRRFLDMDIEWLNELSTSIEQMRQVNAGYKEEFPVGTKVRIVSETQLRDFKKNWKLHNPLTEEQIKFAGWEGKVKSVGFHNDGDEIYEIEGIEGVWHQVCLDSI